MSSASKTILARANEKTMGMQTLTLLLPVHNRGSLTAYFITHVEELLPPNISLSVVLFDDGCNDETIATACRAWPKADVVTLDGHAFWGGALNAISNYVQGRVRQGKASDFYMLCNDDIRFPGGKTILAGLDAASDMALVCARGIMVSHAEIINSDSTLSKPEWLPEHAIHYSAKDGRFIRASESETVNVAPTRAMLTTPKPWLHAVTVPPSIPHYLSDYWLTYNLYKLGFQIAHPEHFICLVSSETTRNKQETRSTNWLTRKLASMKGCITKTSPIYVPAWICFYRQDPLTLIRRFKILRLWLLFRVSGLTLALLGCTSREQVD